jgi:alkanesulfonate monooxygenase SsuD/methylene tetrahydromethanopterin reductase-like flavin-dependent oxidoreductase (luciferase family)
VEEEAALHGRQVDRTTWRVVGQVHVAESEARAVEQAKWGYDDALKFAAATGVGPPAEMDVATLLETTTHDDRVRGYNEAQRGSIGTPQMAIDLIERLKEQSGGFGTFLIRLGDAVSYKDRLASLELFAHEVMPHFQGSTKRPTEAWDRFFDARKNTVSTFRNAQDLFSKSHAEQRAASEPKN